jgi:hypothetical protein
VVLHGLGGDNAGLGWLLYWTGGCYVGLGDDNAILDWGDYHAGLG